MQYTWVEIMFELFVFAHPIKQGLRQWPSLPWWSALWEIFVHIPFFVDKTFWNHQSWTKLLFIFIFILFKTLILLYMRSIFRNDLKTNKHSTLKSFGYIPIFYFNKNSYNIKTIQWILYWMFNVLMRKESMYSPSEYNNPTLSIHISFRHYKKLMRSDRNLLRFV